MSTWQKAIVIYMIFAVCASARFCYLSWEAEGKGKYDQCQIAKNVDCDQRFPKEAESLRKAIADDFINRRGSTGD